MAHRHNIYVVRHGESLATLDPTLFGRMNPEYVPLSQWGYDQIVEAGKACRAHHDATNTGKPLDIFHSHHLRIVQSKDGFLQGFGTGQTTPARSDKRLGERVHGQFDGLDQAAQKELDPKIFGKLHSPIARLRFMTRMPDGESMQDVQSRLESFLEEYVMKPHEDKSIVILTHGGNCRVIENILTHERATWLYNDTPPGTGDILFIPRIGNQPGTSSTLFEGRKRPSTMPKDYKTAEYDPHKGIIIA